MPMALTSTSNEDVAAVSAGEENLGGRARRSAAVHSNRAWVSLMPSHHKKNEDLDESSDIQDLQDKEDKTAKKKISTTPASRKRLRAQKIELMPDDDETISDTPENSNAKPVEKKKVSVSPLQQKQKQKLHDEKVILSTPTKRHMSNEKSQNSPVVEADKPKNLPPILPKRLSILAQKQSKQSSGDVKQEPVLFRASNQSLLKIGSGALNKEQIEKIDREVEKHQFNSLQEDDGVEEEDETIKLDDPDDQDYEDVPSRLNKRSVSKPRGTYKKRDLQTGNRTPRLSRYMAKKLGLDPSIITVPSSVNSISSNAGTLQFRKPMDNGKSVNSAQRPNINGGGSISVLNYGNNNGSYPPQLIRGRDDEFLNPENRTVKVLRIRPAGSAAPLNSNLPRQPQLIPPVSYNAMVSDLSREIGDLSEKYQTRVVPGSAVHEFNSLIDQITQELNRVVEDKARLVVNQRDYLEQLNASHASQIEYKDRKIHQLENTIETLQSKLMVAFKRIQLNALKHDTAVSSSGPVNGNITNVAKHMANNETLSLSSISNQPNSVEKGSASVAGVASSSNSSGACQHSQVLSIQQQKPIQQLHGPARFYEDDDENFDIEEERPPKIKFQRIDQPQPGGVVLSATGACSGSIFRSSRVVMPTSLSIMNKQNLNQVKSYCGESEEGFDDDEGDLDEEELGLEEDELVDGGEVGANQTVL